MYKNWKLPVLIGLVIMIFPVMITLIVSKINETTAGETKPSGKTILLENESYRAEMDMEDFIPCVLMAQTSIDSPKEMLKAQAVVLRTYILYRMGEEDSISEKELGLPYRSYGQLEDMWFRSYRMEHPKSIDGMLGNLTGLGKSRIFKNNRDYLDMIMEKTDGKVLRKNGKVILPLYHGISSGLTRSGSDILGSDYSYLKSVSCSSDIREENYIGVQYVTIQQLWEKLKAYGIVPYKGQKELSPTGDTDLQEWMKLIECSAADAAGYVSWIKIGDTKIAAEDFVVALHLKSNAMEIGTYEKGIRITTRGEGHGFGMSLTYAKKLAAQGKEWQEILKTFYDAAISDE